MVEQNDIYSRRNQVAERPQVQRIILILNLLMKICEETNTIQGKMARFPERPISSLIFMQSHRHLQ